MQLTIIYPIIIILLFWVCKSDPAVRTLVNEKNVKDVLITLFVETDNRHWEKVKSCFADEVLFDMTSLAGGEPVRMTPQQIVDGWANGLKALQAIHHQVGNFKIEVSTNEANAFCYGIASHYLSNDSGKNTRTFIGSYDFHLILIDNIWKIDQFKFNSKYVTGNLNLEASE